MQLYIFSVYDKAVQAYATPMFFRSKGEAVRSFTDAVNQEKSQFATHAADYVLYYIGQFDDNAGMFDSGEPVRVIGADEVFAKAP